jgi:hypothetical protein
MMSGWNRRHASERGPGRARRRVRAGWRAGAPLAACCLASFLLGSSAEAPAATPHLVLADSTGATPAIRSWVTEDAAWLRTLPADLAAPPDSAAGLLAWLRAVGARMKDTGPAAPGDGTRLRDLRSLLRDRWLARGYLAARIVAAPAGGDSLVVRPGSAYRLGALSVDGPDFPRRERLLDSTLPTVGDRFLPSRWEDGVQRLLEETAEMGHPFTQWLVREAKLDTAASTLAVEAVLLPGPQVVVGPQTSDLPAGRGESFLRKATGLQRGALYQESALRRARERLLDRGLYAAVGEPVVYLTSSRDTVGVHWPVAPVVRPNRVQVVLGLSRRQDGATELSGQVDLRLPNLGGTGRRLAASWSNDGRSRSHLGFSYLEPLALGTPFDAEGSVDNEVVQDAYSRFRLDGRLFLPVVAAWGLELGLGWDRSTFPAGELARASRWRARGAFVHRRLDPLRSGWSGLFALETVLRQATARADTAALDLESTGRSDRERLLEVDVSGELWLGGATSMAGRASLREVIAEGGAVIPLSEQYNFGGAQTVRGYREDEFRGERVAYGGVELRLGRPGGARVYTFLDLGYFEFSVPEPLPQSPSRRVQRDGTVHGFGLGLRTGAPGGDISLAVGFPGHVDFDSAKLHVSLLGAF